MSEIISYSRQSTNTEHRSVEVPDYKNFWLRASGPFETIHYIACFSDEMDEKSMVIDISDKGNVAVWKGVLDVELIIKTTKKILEKMDVVNSISEIEWRENAQNIFTEVLGLKRYIFCDEEE